MAEHWDVVVVGAGTAGCPLAARLADAGRRVLLLEAGAHHPDPAAAPAELRDAATLRAAVSGHPANWDLPGLLPGGREVRVPRGRVSGGSSAVNAGYFVRPTPSDAAGWAAAGNDLWAWERLLPALRRMESDREYGDRPGHGADGPVPVTRPAGGSRLARAFAAGRVGSMTPNMSTASATRRRRPQEVATKLQTHLAATEKPRSELSLISQ